MGFVDFGRGNLIEVAVQHDEVGEFAGSDGAFDLLSKLGVG